MLTSRITWEGLRTFDAATLSGSYQALGDPLEHPAYKLKMVNNSTSLVTISINGTSDIDVCPNNSFWLYDETQTHLYEMLPARTQVYIKGSAGTGNIYLVSQYIVQR